MKRQPATTRHKELGPDQLDAVAELFGVLSEPTRLRILQALHAGPLCVSQIIDETGLKQANVSKQLGILFSAGIVGRERDGLQVRYTIRMNLVFELCGLVCDGLARHAHERSQVWKTR